MYFCHSALAVLTVLVVACTTSNQRTHFDWCGSSSLQDHYMLIDACGVGNVEEVKRLLLDQRKQEQEGKQQAEGTETCPAYRGPTPLQAAAHAGAVDVVKLLLGLNSILEGGEGVLLRGVDVNVFDSETSKQGPWVHLNAAHFALDGWFAQATGSFALFQEPFGPPLPHVKQQTNRYEVVLQLLLDAGLKPVTLEGSDAFSFAVELKLAKATKMLATAADCAALARYAGVAEGVNDQHPQFHRKVGSPILHTAVTIEQWHSQVCRSLFRGDAGVATDGSRLTHGHAVMHAPSIQKPTLKCKQAEVWPAVQAHNAAVVAAVVHDGFQRCGLRIPHSSSSRGSRRGSGEGSEGGDANVETSTEPAPEPALVLAARFGNLLTAKVLLDAGVDVGITDVGGQTAFHVSAARGYERVLVALLEAAAAQGKIAAVLFKYKDEHGRLASDLALLQTGKCLLSTLATVCRLAQNDGDIVCASVNPANVVSFHAACTNDGDLKSGGRDGDGPSAAVNAASTEEAMKSSARPVAASKFGWRRYAQGVVPRLLSPKNNATRALPPDAIHEGAISPEDFLRLHQSASRPGLFKGAALDWDALHLWTPDHLARMAADEMVSTGNIPYPSQDGGNGATIPLAQFLIAMLGISYDSDSS
eukprot:gene20119-5029_t